jgi:hypothetical protein
LDDYSIVFEQNECPEQEPAEPIKVTDVYDDPNSKLQVLTIDKAPPGIIAADVPQKTKPTGGHLTSWFGAGTQRNKKDRLTVSAEQSSNEDIILIDLPTDSPEIGCPRKGAPLYATGTRSIYGIFWDAQNSECSKYAQFYNITAHRSVFVGTQ